MEILHNSYEEKFRKPFGAALCNSTIKLAVLVTDPIPSLKCSATIWINSDDMKLINMSPQFIDGKILYQCEFKAPAEPCLLWYHFVLENYEEKYYYGDNDKQYGGTGRVYDTNPKSYQITVYEKENVPTWYKEGIAYQIFPDRFSRGTDYEIRKAAGLKYIEGTDRERVYVDWNEPVRYERDDLGGVRNWQFYGGTLKGIEEKLPYLKELGVTVIYLNPIFEARSNHKYDTADYMKIDPGFGDTESFVSLMNKAKNMGIHILLDGVFSHTGADSIYFNKQNNYDSLGAYQSKDSKYYKWYKMKENIDDYDCWWGVKDLPEVNEMNEDFLNFICRDNDSVVKHWIRLGASGFRLDVADELPDSFIEEIKKAMVSVNKDTVLLGEVWEDASNKISYGKRRKYFSGRELQSIMNYELSKAGINFMKGIINAEDLKNLILHQAENYPIEYFYSNFNLISSHDRIRAMTLLGDCPDKDNMTETEMGEFSLSQEKYDLAKSRIKVLSTLQFTLPGIPMIYYGDEVGLSGYTDPYNRKPYPWGNEDLEILEHYKKLSKIRLENNAILKGDYKVYSFYEHVIGFLRKYKNEEVLILGNRGIFFDEAVDVEIDTDGDYYIDLFTNDKYDVENNKLKLNILPLGYKILKKCRR